MTKFTVRFMEYGLDGDVSTYRAESWGEVLEILENADDEEKGKNVDIRRIKE